jgi:GNAT superfamily N-acetyltransferase
MTIRLAGPSDIPAVVEMGLRFAASSAYTRSGGLFTYGRVTLLVEHALAEGVIFVAERDGQLEGFIGFSAAASPFTGEAIAGELAWWVEPHARTGSVGPRLLAAAEEWARRKSLRVIQMVAPSGSMVGAFLERRGYVAVETIYRKGLHEDARRPSRTPRRRA